MTRIIIQHVQYIAVQCRYIIIIIIISIDYMQQITVS